MLIFDFINAIYVFYYSCKMPMKGSGDEFLLITEEIEICKRLSANDVRVRKKGLLALKHLLKHIHKRKGKYAICFCYIAKVRDENKQLESYSALGY